MSDPTTTAALAAGLNRISRNRRGLTRYANDSNRVKDEAAMQDALEELQRAGWTITPPRPFTDWGRVG